MSPLLYQLSYTARAAKLTTYDAIVKGTIMVLSPTLARLPSCALRLADRQGRSCYSDRIPRAFCAPVITMLTTSGTLERMRLRGTARRSSPMF